MADDPAEARDVELQVEELDPKPQAQVVGRRGMSAAVVPMQSVKKFKSKAQPKEKKSLKGKSTKAGEAPEELEDSKVGRCSTGRNEEPTNQQESENSPLLEGVYNNVIGRGDSDPAEVAEKIKKFKETKEELARQYHNANFQPNLNEVVVNFCVVLTSPLYLIGCALIALWNAMSAAVKYVAGATIGRCVSAAIECCCGKSNTEGEDSTPQQITEKSEATKRKRGVKRAMTMAEAMQQSEPYDFRMFWHDKYMWRSLLNPLTALSILANIDVLLWFAAGEDWVQVSLTEVWMPRWVIGGLTLLLATSWDLDPSMSSSGVSQTQDGQSDVGAQDGFRRSMQSITAGFSEYFHCGRQGESIPHDANQQYHQRIENFNSKLKCTTPEGGTESYNNFKKRLTHFDEDYKDAFRTKEKEMDLEVLKEQMQTGWPAHKGPIYCMGLVLWIFEIGFGMFLICLCAMAPGLLREVREHRGHFLPKNPFAQCVAFMFILFMFLDWILTCALPGLMRKLFSHMAQSFRLLNAMLMGEDAATAHFIPHVRVGQRSDIAAWYELYVLLISNTQRKKFPLEVAFAHNSVTVVGLSLFVFAYGLDPEWQPDVLFFQTILHLIAFFIFSLPPLVVGLRVNMLQRRTVDLLWGHATESRAYLCRLEGDLEELEKMQEKNPQDWSVKMQIEELNKLIKEAKSATDLTVDIAQRLRLDTALVVRTLGMELTVAQFTAIASLASSALIYAFQHRALFQDKIAEAFTPLGTETLEKFGNFTERVFNTTKGG